jgi:hypothetical protein
MTPNPKPTIETGLCDPPSSILPRKGEGGMVGSLQGDNPTWSAFQDLFTLEFHRKRLRQCRLELTIPSLLLQVPLPRFVGEGGG